MIEIIAAPGFAKGEHVRIARAYRGLFRKYLDTIRVVLDLGDVSSEDKLAYLLGTVSEVHPLAPEDQEEGSDVVWVYSLEGVPGVRFQPEYFEKVLLQ